MIKDVLPPLHVELPDTFTETRRCHRRCHRHPGKALIEIRPSQPRGELQQTDVTNFFSMFQVIPSP